MNTSTHTARRGATIRRAVRAAALVLIGALPIVASTTPASASEGANGCTVTIARPEWRSLSDDSKQVRGLAHVRCAAARTVSMQLGVREADPNGSYDTFITPVWGAAYSLAANTSYPFRTGWAACRNTEVGDEEAYGLARISVNSAVSGWDSGRDALQVSLAC